MYEKNQPYSERDEDAELNSMMLREAEVELEGEGGYFTYAEYLRLQLEGYYELLRGYLVKMPSPVDGHQVVTGWFHAELYQALKGTQCQVRIAPYDVRLFPAEDHEQYTVVQPDVCVICDASIIERRGCHGAPDLVIEVLSKRTQLKDRTTKMLLYEQAGVREYWIVDVHDQQLEVRVLNDGVYPPLPSIYGKGSEVESTVVAGFGVSIDEVFSQILPGTI